LAWKGPFAGAAGKGCLCNAAEAGDKQWECCWDRKEMHCYVGVPTDHRNHLHLKNLYKKQGARSQIGMDKERPIKKVSFLSTRNCGSILK
jgi:hypothetical protein